MLENKNEEYFNTLTEEEKSWIVKTLEILEKDFSTSDELQTEIYGVVKYLTADAQELKKYQKRFFEILYNLLLGKSQGPKLGIFLLAIDNAKLTNLLTF